MRRSKIALILPAAVVCAIAWQRPQESAPSAPPDRVSDAFAAGWMLSDTNGDGIADSIAGKIVVPAHPSEAENAAAADLAGRAGFGSTGLTLPLVVNAAADTADGPRIWVGKDAVPAARSQELLPLLQLLEKDEGGVFAVGDNLAVVGTDDNGLLAAAEAYSARAPYQWRINGDKLSAIVDAARAAASEAHSRLIGVSYMRGQPGIRRAFLDAGTAVTAAALGIAVGSAHLAAVHELVVLGGASAVNPKSFAPGPTAPVPAATAQPGGEGAGGSQPPRLDLATLYTSHGLFTGTAKMPVPSNLDTHLYVPASAAGTAMANLAARMGLETTGLTLPLASTAAGVRARDVKTQAVIAGESDLAREAERKLRSQDTVAAQAETNLSPGEGELRIVDDSFGRRGAVLVRGDDTGSAAALDLLSERFPNVWETGKQHLSLEEIRYDLHQFFSFRSSAGQAAAGLYHLEQWMKQIGQAGNIKNVKAELFVDLADPRLTDLLRREIQRELQVSNADVVTSSLHAGTKCCDKNPDLHYQNPAYPFHQAAPTFNEDMVIVWEGKRLVQAVKDASSGIRRGQSAKLLARVSEGPDQRRKLQTQLQELLTRAGADPKHLQVLVLCAYKPGYSWLMDEIAPELAGKAVASIQIEFAKNVDPTGVRAMYSPARWVQELYPVDEMLARKLNLPLEKITLQQMESPPNGPTYRVHALDGGGKEILTREFTVTTALQPYNGVVPRYEQVQVDTGWVRLESGSRVLLDQRIRTDIEEFWDHYQNQTLPKVFQSIMAQTHGEIRQEFVPLFDTLRLDIHMSEPDYNLDLDKERISALEALQEDTFYATENFVNMTGDLETGRPITYAGRVIPMVHPSEDGQDGRVHIEFYAKAAPNPLVRLSWTDASGKRQERERNLPALSGEMQPRLIQARVKAGESGPESLTWTVPADFLEDKYEEWLKVEGQDQVDRSIFSVEQARGQLHWLEQMHAAGLYRDDVAYPHLKQMALEFELPRPVTAKIDTPEPRAYVTWTVPAPANPRPMISDYAAKLTQTPIVQWDEPISPEENAAILARFASYPGANVYWMGRSYLGQNTWAADLMLPSPSVLRSAPKETTLKASIIYSGRQHANEVSSTSHIAKLGEQLLTDPEVRAMLKKVNVVLHPIDNPDGAQLSVLLAQITPDNMLHPGYHGALAADVSTGQTETDPTYPESRTRRRLIETWLPDAFLNPHGYPSHEWVQPFSEYSGWVQNRQGANSGRAWWIPRGWFTSLTYLRDPEHPYSEPVAYAIRDRIVEAERNVPGLLALETRMNSRYERYGQRWQPRNMLQPVVNGIRIYMALKGSAGRRGAAGGAGGQGGPGGQTAPGSGGVGGINPEITWDSGYTEAPDETAHGDYMKLMASAGLAFDYVHLKYLAEGELRITRTQREVGGRVQWRVERARPILPSSISPLPAPTN